MSLTRRRVLIYVGCVLWTTVAAGQAPEGGVDPDRVAEIAGMLDPQPFAFGPTIEDRAAWAELARRARLRGAVERAQKLMDQPIPDLPDELYLDYSRTGNRENYQRVLARRHDRLMPLVIAECIENQGRFLPAIERLVAAICAQKSWVLPAHDPKLENFNQTNVTIDLVSSLVANELAQARFLLGDRLNLETRKLIDENIERRVVGPFRKTLDGDRPGEWWITGKNNWNSVCLANVTGAALATIGDRAERARFVAAAEKYSQHFLDGFTEDGYCSEGLAYWNYGFSHYARLAELLRQATKGELNLYERPKVRAIALFPLRLEIINGVYPAFADCPVDAVPPPLLLDLLNDRLDLGIGEWESTKRGGLHRQLVTTMWYACSEPSDDGRARATSRPTQLDPLRGFFEDAQVLSCRPAPGSLSRFGVALKGGHNAEQHNHNDVGSYVVVVGKSPLLLDPGAEVYTARTFGKDRYQSKVLNSFGHPVPIVAGQLQRTGRAAQAKVLRREFTDAADTVVLDIRACYGVPALTKLHRSFVYRRDGDGSFTVTDEAEFDSPQSFGTALVTLSKWKQLSPSSMMIYDENEAVRVDLDTGGAEFTIDAETIDEDVRTPTQPTRIGINLKHPGDRAKIIVTMTPDSPPADK